MKLRDILLFILSIIFIGVGLLRIQIFIFDILNQSKYINFYEVLFFNHLPNLITILACFIVGFKIIRKAMFTTSIVGNK